MNGGVELQEGDVFEEEAVMAAVKEREMWLYNNSINGQNDQSDDLLAGVVEDASMFYADDFPPLPDFPCMSSSSSSSSSSTPTPVKTVTCGSGPSSSSSNTSSSSAASWAVLKSDAEDYVPPSSISSPPAPPLSSTASMEIPQPSDHGGGGCMDMMDTNGYMELLESNDFFNPSSIFQNEENYPLDQELEFAELEQNNPLVLQQEEHANAMVLQQQQQQQQQQQLQPLIDQKTTDDEMSSVFLEWLKTNKDSVSASDLRSVKIKKATIECAAKRLGGGKEAMMQLLKLILEWVQTSHLQNKRRKENHNITDNNNNSSSTHLLITQFQDNPNPTSNFDHQASFGPEWISLPPYETDPATLVAAPAPFPQPMLGYVGDPFSSGASTEFHMLESTHSWPPPHYDNNQSFGDNNLHPPPLPPYQYPYQFLHGSGAANGMRLGPSATKEARKKRMARQRRHLPQLRHHNHHGRQSQQNQTSDYCTAATVAAHTNNPANWLYWPPVVAVGGGATSVAPVVPAEPPLGRHVADRTAMQTDQNYQEGRVISSSDRRQGSCKPEKNLRFLLQKVLKQSDVGNLGRIVLPKKEAETHLPELEARDGISIAMEDIGTSRVWNMRYRYWPNNKSRMYLLENTGDFVRANGLQEGDFIVIYSDVKCGKFMIRGVKVRQAGAKPETKKAGNSQKNQHGNNTDQANGSPSSSPKTAQMQKNETSSTSK